MGTQMKNVPKRNIMTLLKANTDVADIHILAPISLSNGNGYSDDNTTNASDGYLGSVSDKVATDHSGILNHLKAMDLILADKGFLLHHIIPQGMFRNLPAFLRGKQKFTKAVVVFSRKIARSRIHVERAIVRSRVHVAR